jgi:cobalt-zinc-cadmium efflux system membrane fusion protein
MREARESLRKVALRGIFAGLLLWACLGCSRESAVEPSKGPPGGERHGLGETNRRHESHGHHDENGEGARKEGRSPSLEEIAALRCEHDVPAYQCASCRYEVGVVKVPASLMKEGSQADRGLVRTEFVEKIGVADGLTVTGEVRVNENAAAHISPRIPGIIESVHVDIGTRVRRGDVLFTMSSVELGKALSDYKRSRALAALSEKNLEREKSLFEQKISSEQEMIDAQMDCEQHKAERDAARQALRALGLTEEDLSRIDPRRRGERAGSLPVRAPLDGTVIEKHAVAGELVEPGSDRMLLADLTTVWVWADIYEQDLPRLMQARSLGPIPVDVRVGAFPGRSFEGTVDYVGATMEERTRTVKVRAAVENTDHLLRPGMFCEIRIGIDARQEALAIPKAALLSDEGRDFVFSLWKEDYFIRRPVKKGREFPEHVEITEGLVPGEKIVAEGAFLLKSDILREKMGAGCAD